MNRKILDKLENIVGHNNFTTEKEDLICYSYDATGMECLPDAVAFPESVNAIAEIMKLASCEGFPVIPRGAGSGFVGGALPVKGGLVLTTRNLNRIIEIDRENMVAVVEPGVVTGNLQKEVEAIGLFYPPDPSSLKFCTIGGNVAVGAGGPRAVKYGVTRDYVLGLEVVLPTGEIISTGTRTTKGVVGYDLTRLFIGSEGTLGIVTKILLKLIPKPQEKITLLAEFQGAFEASETVSAIMTSGLLPSALEYIDSSALQCVREKLKDLLGKKTSTCLIIELDGSLFQVEEDAKKVESLCARFGAHALKKAKDKKEADDLWETRRAISPSLFKLGTKKINEDIAVPRTMIPQLTERLKTISEKYELIMANFGHAGDGNIHVNIMIDKGNKEEEAKAEKAVEEVFRAALELHGTISGEHGVGISKQPYIGMELGNREIEIMKGIKRVFDPQNILNPGKIFPESV